MGWIIKLKIYVALTAAVNPRYTKTREINKEKSGTELTDFTLLKSLSRREKDLLVSRGNEATLFLME